MLFICSFLLILFVFGMSPRSHTFLKTGVTRSIARSNHSTTRSVHQMENFLGVGQSHDQWRISPNTVIGDVHSFVP